MRIQAVAALSLCVSAHAWVVPTPRLSVAPRSTAASLRSAPAPIAQLGFGKQGRLFNIDARAAKRLSQMTPPEEPLKEEVKGLSLLGIVLGALVLPNFGCNAFFGSLIGWQFAPLLSILGGPVGESCRAAGWEASARWEATAKRVNVEWQAADAKYELRQRWERFDLAGKCKAFDEAYDVRGKLRELQSLLVLYVWKPLLAQWARLVAALEMRGITPKIREWITASGLPAWISAQQKTWEENQVLRQRIRQVDMRQREGLD